MRKNFKIIIFAALCTGIENCDHTWNSSFERHYPTEIGSFNNYPNAR